MRKTRRIFKLIETPLSECRPGDVIVMHGGHRDTQQADRAWEVTGQPYMENGHLTVQARDRGMLRRYAEPA